jgi:hypothetical protein
LKLKTKGASVILLRGPNTKFKFMGAVKAGVRILTPASPNPPGYAEQAKKAGVTLRTVTDIELLVDGDIVDLNRIRLPANTPIIDKRFKDRKTKLTSDTARIPERNEETTLKQKEALRDAALKAAERVSDRLSDSSKNNKKNPGDAPTDGKGTAKASSGDRVQLHGQWIVRMVKIDGKATPAQIGREVGDVITIKKQGVHLALS